MIFAAYFAIDNHPIGLRVYNERKWLLLVYGFIRKIVTGWMIYLIDWIGMTHGTVLSIYRLLRQQYRSSRKQTLDEEFVLYRIYRPLSFPLTALLIKVGFTANQTTIASALVLISGAVALSFGGSYLLFIGAILYSIAFVLDFADGNIARFHGTASYFGKLVDGLVDSLTWTIFVGAAIGAARSGDSLFTDATLLGVGFASAAGFLMGQYFRARLAYLHLEAHSQGMGSASVALTTEGYASENKGVLRNLARLHRNAITGTPILLLLSAYFNVIWMFIVVMFLLHVVAGTAEIVLGLWRVRKRLDITRPY